MLKVQLAISVVLQVMPDMGMVDTEDLEDMDSVEVSTTMVYTDTMGGLCVDLITTEFVTNATTYQVEDQDVFARVCTVTRCIYQLFIDQLMFILIVILVLTNSLTTDVLPELTFQFQILKKLRVVLLNKV